MTLRPSNKHVQPHMVIQPAVIYKTCNQWFAKTEKNCNNSQTVNDTKAKQKMKLIFLKAPHMY